MIEKNTWYLCKSKLVSDTFLHEAELLGVRWYSGHLPTELDYFTNFALYCIDDIDGNGMLCHVAGPEYCACYGRYVVEYLPPSKDSIIGYLLARGEQNVQI